MARFYRDSTIKISQEGLVKLKESNIEPLFEILYSSRRMKKLQAFSQTKVYRPVGAENKFLCNVAASG